MSGMERQEFFATRNGVALTYDDVTLQTARSEYGAHEVDISGRFTRNIELTLPFVSAAMDTVTESRTAIAMAKMGGIGVVHAGLSIEDQYGEVRKVKHTLRDGLVHRPKTVTQGMTLGSVLRKMEAKDRTFRTFPVIDGGNKLVGLVTQNDFDMFGESTRISRAMTPLDQVVTAVVGTTLNQAHRIMLGAKKKTLPVLEEDGSLAGLYIWSDVVRALNENPDGYTLDAEGRLCVAAAVPTDEAALDRVRRMGRYVDAVVLDSAQGDSKYAFSTLELIQQIRDEYPHLDIMVGNVTDGPSARDLAEAGADAVKTGQGPGSICTTRRETGIGTPQVTAVYEDARHLEGMGIPLCADGGIVNHGDPIKAFAAGAESVMMGSILAGTDEAPGEIIEYEGGLYKEYRGMGSASALKDSASARNRYGGSVTRMPRPEGIESLVRYTGSVEDVVGAFRDLLAKGMSYVGAKDFASLRENTHWWQVTNSGIREARPHDVLPLPSDVLGRAR